MTRVPPPPPKFSFYCKKTCFWHSPRKNGGVGVCSFKVTSTSQFWRDDGSRIWQLWQPVSEQTAEIAAATNTPVRKLNSFRTVHNKILGSNPYASRHQVEKWKKYPDNQQRWLGQWISRFVHSQNWQQCQPEEKNLCFLCKRAKKLYSKECRGWKQTWDLSKNLHDQRFQGKKFTQKTRNFRHLLNRDKKCVNALNWDKTSKKCSVTM